MPRDPDPIFNSGAADDDSLSFSDLLFQNERAMWWAEFDGVGEEVVRSYVERSAYPPTGMEAARQWLARREFLQLRGDVQSIKALAEQVQGTASESLKNASEALTLASQVDANSRAIVEIAADAKKSARTMVAVGVIVSLFALGAIVMVLASSWPSSQQAAPNTKQAFAPPAHPKQAVVPPLPSAVPPAEMGQAAAMPPARPKQAVVPPLPPAAPPAEAPPAEMPQASAIPPENAPKTQQPSDAAQIESPDLKPEGRSLAEVLALIADKVGGEGAVNFAAQFHDMATGRDDTERLSYKTSNVTIDPNRCRVGYHWHVEQDGKTVSDQDRTIEFRLAKSIRMTPIDVSGRQFSMRADPKVYVVHIARWDNASGDDLYFRDKDMAARVGTATRRAVELCDNGVQQFRRR